MSMSTYYWFWAVAWLTLALSVVNFGLLAWTVMKLDRKENGK